MSLSPIHLFILYQRLETDSTWHMEEKGFLKWNLVFYVQTQHWKSTRSLEPQKFQIPGGLFMRSRASVPRPGDNRGVTSQPSCTPGKVTSQFCLWHSTSSSPLPRGNVTSLMMCPKPAKYQPGEGWVTFNWKDRNIWFLKMIHSFSWAAHKEESGRGSVLKRCGRPSWGTTWKD